MAKASAKASAKPTTSVFGSAPVITVAKPASKSTAVEVAMPGLGNVAALKAVIDALTAVMVEEDRLVKAQMDEHFIKVGMATKRQPDNFKGVDGIGSASCQLRAKSAALSDEGKLLAIEHDIETVTETKVVETFVVNPAYASDPEWVAKLEAACGAQLTELADHRGATIQKQEAVESVKVTDLGRNQVFTKSEDVIRTLMPVMFTPAIRAKLETNGDLKPAIAVVQKLFGSPLFEEAAKQSKKAAA
jgi:hypothetical protein